MSPTIDSRVIHMLVDLVKKKGLNGGYTDKQISEFEAERKWILAEFARIDEATYPDSWWSDSEYEWFLNRVLDFLDAPRGS